MEAHASRSVQVAPLKPALERETVIAHRALLLLTGATRSLLTILKTYKQS